jgi:hypothetical protein
MGYVAIEITGNETLEELKKFGENFDDFFPR